MLSKVPSFIILSIEAIFFTALRMVGKLVSMPPGQRSITKGMPTEVARSATTCLACFLVATKRTFLPDLAMFFKADAASSSLAWVL